MASDQKAAANNIELSYYMDRGLQGKEGKRQSSGAIFSSCSSFFFTRFLFKIKNIVCMRLSYVTSAAGGQKRVANPLELKFQAAVTCPT